MTDANKEAQKMILDCVPCVYYLVQFQKKKSMIWALIDSTKKVNAITPAYTTKLGIKVWKANVRAQKISDSLPTSYKMFIATFQVLDKFGKARFLQKSFLMANTNMKVILEMFFFTFSNVDIQFAENELTWRFYTTKEALLTT